MQPWTQLLHSFLAREAGLTVQTYFALPFAPPIGNKEKYGWLARLTNSGHREDRPSHGDRKGTNIGNSHRFVTIVLSCLAPSSERHGWQEFGSVHRRSGGSNPGFPFPSCETKSGTESLGARLERWEESVVTCCFNRRFFFRIRVTSHGKKIVYMRGKSPYTLQ